jgi:hypothetical protein
MTSRQDGPEFEASDKAGATAAQKDQNVLLHAAGHRIASTKLLVVQRDVICIR